MSARQLEEWRRTAGRCVVCGSTFNELHNVGSWACAQHASEPVGGIYPCCGARHRGSPHRFRRGCVPADHNSMDFGTSDMPPRWTRHHDVTLTDEALREMPRVQRTAVIESSDAGYFRETRVRRFADPNLALYSELARA